MVLLQGFGLSGCVCWNITCFGITVKLFIRYEYLYDINMEDFLIAGVHVNYRWHTTCN